MKHLPNALTLANLFCGCCALLAIFHGQPEVAAWFTAGCFFFDYLDGMAARAVGVQSPLGKELDSLADVVSFGVVPGAMLYQLLGGSQSSSDVVTAVSFIRVEALPAFVLSAFSALRLAKFNLDTRQSNYFIGLTTPACTVLVLGLALAAHNDRFGLAETIRAPWFLYGLIGVLSWFLTCEIPMFGMKIKGLDWKGNKLNLLFILLFSLLLFFLKELSLTATVVCYVLVSIVKKDKIVAT